MSGDSVNGVGRIFWVGHGWRWECLLGGGYRNHHFLGFDGRSRFF